jgi:hypothetical protein
VGCGGGEKDKPHSTEGVLDLDLADDLVAVRLDLLEQLALLWDYLLEGVLEAGLGGGGVGAGGIGDDGAEGGRLERSGSGLE